jgi:hypothetical protein
MKPNNFTKQFQDHISFTYTCFDRIIVRGYILSLFQLGSVVNLLRNLNFKKLSQGVLGILRDQLSDHVKKMSIHFCVDIIWWTKGTNGSKHKYVEKHYYRKAKKENKYGPLCIIKAKENIKSIECRDDLTSKNGKKYSKLYSCKKYVSQYYIYINDKDLGLCYLKISGYLPFPSEFYMNGHNYLEQQMIKEGIKYRKVDNSFVYVSNPLRLQKLSDTMNFGIINDRIQFWWDIFFKFNKGTYSTRSKLLTHDWYSYQVEVCSNTIFKSSTYGSRIFNKLLQKHHTIGLPDRLSEVFERKREPNESKTTQRVFGTQACIKHWLKRNSIKMYNKSGYLHRVETTINNISGLPGGLKKPICYVQGLYWYGLGCNNRFLNTMSDVSPDEILEQEVERKMQETIITDKGQRIAAPDPRKSHQYELFKVLLMSKFSAIHFRSKDLKPYLSDHYSNTTKIGYELKKLRVRGLVDKKQGANYYLVTEFGYKWLWMMISEKQHFSSSLLSVFCKKEDGHTSEQWESIPTETKRINRSLTQIYQSIRLVS